jgi:hypothetical protein
MVDRVDREDLMDLIDLINSKKGREGKREQRRVVVPLKLKNLQQHISHIPCEDMSI